MEEAPAENTMVVDHRSREWARLIRCAGSAWKSKHIAWNWL
jgi:hypothetical protein